MTEFTILDSSRIWMKCSFFVIYLLALLLTERPFYIGALLPRQDVFLIRIKANHAGREQSEWGRVVAKDGVAKLQWQNTQSCRAEGWKTYLLPEEQCHGSGGGGGDADQHKNGETKQCTYLDRLTATRTTPRQWRRMASALEGGLSLHGG
ncbi:hypothetical protein PIB30_067321 [Stylosanthes scabra]|uniref:Uncharacterized protein n=1 Tax=Stylosanthes scabra TaxID=79078 RepID=A0ABU6RMY5_9FABA|nr:hypothetical protein [Stylosanthes scabra]